MILLKTHVYPSGQLAKKGSVRNAMAAGSGGMPKALSELSPEDLHGNIKSTEQPQFQDGSHSKVQLERDPN